VLDLVNPHGKTTLVTKKQCTPATKTRLKFPIPNRYETTVHLKDLNVLPQNTRITKPKPLLQQQKLDFKTTAFFIKKHTLPKEKRKQPTHFKQKRNHITE
jgi:hypothetical protein